MKLWLGTSIAVYALVLSAVGATSSVDRKYLFDIVNTQLSETREVRLYYNSYLDQRNSTPSRLREYAMATLLIRCGTNCPSVMHGVVSQLAEASVMDECPKGEIFLLIDFGLPDNLMYYRYGKAVQFRDQCYLTETRIDNVIHMFDFF